MDQIIMELKAEGYSDAAIKEELKDFGFIKGTKVLLEVM